MSDPMYAQDRLAGLSRERRALLFEQIRQRQEKESSRSAIERIPRRPPDLEPIPASFAQERLWFMDRLAPGSPAYNIPLALRIEGAVAPALLQAVLAEVVRRHEALRTTFRERGGQPLQVIAPPGRWSLPVVDLAGLPGVARAVEARRLARSDAERPFAIERGPLLRAVLLRSASDEHALLLNLHHIVSDGWSMGVLVGEITALWGAAVAATPSPLRELPIQYADFAVWQRRWLQGEVLERQVAYWRERLAGAPVSLDLPTDRLRPASQTYRGARLRVDLGPDCARGLRRLARRFEASPFMALLAGFMVLLGRWTGQEDLTVGSPIANRHRAEVEPLIGFFINTLVMRGDLRGNPPFGEWLTRVRRTTLEAFAHQDLPFERLVEELRPERHLSVTPLFQVVCAMQNAPVGRVELPGLTLSPLELAATTTQFDLELHAWEANDSLALMISYSTELFEGATVLRLARHLETLLGGAMADSGRRLADLPLLAAAERHQLLCEWNDSSMRLPPAGVVERVTAWAVRTPRAPAVICGGATLTYGELLARASRLAGELRHLGIGSEIPVGLCAGRSPELVVGALAVLLAGGAYLPLDPSYPADRLALVARESGMPVLLVQCPEVPSWAGEGLRVLHLDDSAGSRPPVPTATVPDRLAYVIYTSGSSGRPKGVEVSHAGLLNLVEWHRRTYRVAPGDRATLVASPAFDASVWEIWPYLAAGASLHIPDEEVRLTPDRLLSWLAAEGITLCFLPTPLAEQVLEAAASGTPPGLRLRALLTGGDRLQQRPRAALPFPLVNHYGPTESSVVATMALIEPAAAGLARPPAIGRPVDGLRTHVLDARLDPAPAGIPGELFLGGVGLARGYRGRPELTAERFVPDPFSRAPGERLYRTGDLARSLPDGNLEFLGRADTQVKLRGFRIELGEIESALARHPQVSEAVAAVRAGENGGGQRLVAWVVPRETGEESAGPAAADHVGQWQDLYDQTYGQGPDGEDAAFNLRGWNSSYTGEPIPPAEMREWVDGTVERLLALAHRRVLEVGCGTGLLLFRVAPAAERYVGTDFSSVALDLVRKEAARRGLAQVELARRTADDWSGVEPGSFDLVILNSVVQYFPGVDYLLRVLAGAVQAVRPGGAVFVGDVRSLPLLAVLHESVERFRAGDSPSAEELQRRVRRRVADEEELVLDPALFRALERRLPVGAEVLRKRGRYQNELTRFRYDVVLRVGVGGLEGAPPAAPPRPWRSYANDPLRAKLARALMPELRRALQAALPDYMVPAAFVLLDRLPLTLHGKVDRAALPAPEPPRSGAGGAAPRTPVETKLAALWQEVLGIEDIGLEDNFFALGGHSLLATQLVSRGRTAFGVDVPLRLVFELPTLGELAAGVAALVPAEAAAAVASPEPSPRPDLREAPLSFGQERLWSLDRLRPGCTAFNLPFPLLLRGALVPAALERALGEIRRRQGSLRTRIAERDGAAVQVVDPPGLWRLPRVDLHGLPGPLRRGEMERLVAEDAARPFDLRRGPLFRSLLVRAGEREHALLLTCHHIVSDGWSTHVLLRELAELYAAFIAGEPPRLAAPPVQYAELCARQRERLAVPLVESRLAYWRESLRGAPPLLDFPLDRPRPAVQTYRGEQVFLRLPADRLAALQAVSAAESASLYMTLLAGLALLLHRWSGQEDVVIGSPVAGRGQREAEGLIGFFLNLLPMRVDLSGRPTFRELLRRARLTALGAYAHQDVPFELLLQELRLESDPAFHPVFQVLLNMLNLPPLSPMAGEIPGGLGVELLGLQRVESKLDFTVYAAEGKDGLSLNLVYNPDLFDRGRMAEFLRQYGRLLEQLARDPERLIDSLAPREPAEVAR